MRLHCVSKSTKQATSWKTLTPRESILQKRLQHRPILSKREMGTFDFLTFCQIRISGKSLPLYRPKDKEYNESYGLEGE